MSLTTDEVKSIAHLARIAVDDEQLEPLTNELGQVLLLVEQMNAVDTRDIAPMAHPLHASQRLRSDEVTESNDRESLQRNAPSTADGLYLVPKVIE